MRAVRRIAEPPSRAADRLFRHAGVHDELSQSALAAAGRMSPRPERSTGAPRRPKRHLGEQPLSGQVMTQRDNWGWQARIGLFIVGTEVVPEAEWWAMVPPNVSLHAARVTARAPWARWHDDRSLVELEDDSLRGCRQFVPMCLSAVVVGRQLQQHPG